MKTCACVGHEHEGGSFCQASGVSECGSGMVDWQCTCSLPIKKKLPSEIILGDGPHFQIENILKFLDKYIGPVEVKE